MIISLNAKGLALHVGADLHLSTGMQIFGYVLNFFPN